MTQPISTDFFPFDRILSQSPPELSIVIPVYNEAEILPDLLRTWAEDLKELEISYEFFVINDGSIDRTSRLLDSLRREMPSLRVVHQLNTGHGRAIRRGYELARGKWILQMDGNGRFESGDFFRLWQERLGKRLVLGHRTHRLDSFFRRFFSTTLNWIVKHLFKISISDANVPFRLFEKEPILSLFLQFGKLRNEWESTNLTMSILALKEIPDLVTEVKIPYRKRAKGFSRTSLPRLYSLGWIYLTEMFEIRFKLGKTSLITELRKHTSQNVFLGNRRP